MLKTIIITSVSTAILIGNIILLRMCILDKGKQKWKPLQKAKAVAILFFGFFMAIYIVLNEAIKGRLQRINKNDDRH